MAFEERAHLGAPLQAVLGVWKQVRARLIEGRAVADRNHHVVKPPAFGHVVVDLVRRDDRRGAALGHRRSAFQNPWVFGAKVVVQLAEDVVFAQRFLKTAEARLVVSGAQIEELATVRRNHGESCACLTLGLVGVGQSEQAAEVGVATEIASDHHHVLAIDLEHRADERLHTDLATCLHELDGAVHAAAVGDRKRGHPELLCTKRQLRWMRAAVEEGKVGVTVQLHVWVHFRAYRLMLPAGRR